MRILSVILFCLFFGTVFGQELKESVLKTEVLEVTVFIDKAQITRRKTVELLPGTTVLKFVNRSPFIE
jgi:hypothetical protein